MFTLILQISNWLHFCRCHTPYAHSVNTTPNAILYSIFILSLSLWWTTLFCWSPPTAAAPCYQGEQQNYTAPIKSARQAAMGTALWVFFHMAIMVAEWVILFLHTLDILVNVLYLLGTHKVQFNFKPRWISYLHCPHSLSKNPEAEGQEVVKSTK